MIHRRGFSIAFAVPNHDGFARSEVSQNPRDHVALRSDSRTFCAPCLLDDRMKAKCCKKRFEIPAAAIRRQRETDAGLAQFVDEGAGSRVEGSLAGEKRRFLQFLALRFNFVSEPVQIGGKDMLPEFLHRFADGFEEKTIGGERSFNSVTGVHGANSASPDVQPERVGGKQSPVDVEEDRMGSESGLHGARV